jgi:ribose transport system substrate-binding protein/inositol transport system substrate-binding protein
LTPRDDKLLGGKKMKRIGKILVAAILCVVLFATGCTKKGADGSVAKKKPVIGCTVYYMTEFVTLMVEGIKDEAEKRGLDLILLDALNDPQRQISQIENLIAQKVDAILVANVDSDAIVPAIDLAKRAGIPLVGVNMLINTNEPYYYSGPDDVMAGELSAEYLIKLIGGKGNVVILEGPIGSSAQLQRLEGNRNVLAKYPDVKVLAQQPANWSRAEALALVENWIEAFPQLDGIIAHNDEMALGAIQALEAKGIKGRIPVTAVDAIKDACFAIRDGRYEMTVFQDAEWEGRLGVYLTALCIDGTAPMQRTHLIQMHIIDKSNVQELIDKIYSN